MASLRMRLVLPLFSLIVILSPLQSHAIPTPAPGVPWPPGLLVSLRAPPEQYEITSGYRREVEEIRANRLALESGAPPTEIQGRVKVLGTRRIPIIPTKFTDSGADPIFLPDLQTELFGPYWPTGTMADYFHEASYGALTLTGDVYGWTPLPHDAAFYEGAAGCHGRPNCGGSAALLVWDAIEQQDPWVDFGQYDNDGPDGNPNSGDDDGTVDVVFCVQPKRGGECGTPDGIWSHQSALNFSFGLYQTNDWSVSMNDWIRVDDYVIVPALSCDGGMVEIGVFCHEFMHVFGLPDLYDIPDPNDPNDPGGQSNGVGLWCLMGSGNWGGDGHTPSRPLHPSAWCKQELGWLSPTVVQELMATTPIRAAESFQDAFKIFPSLQSGPEYFLIENRESIGFDTQLPGAGLAIWHIDESRTDNHETRHKLVDLEEADGYESLDSRNSDGDAGDLYPGLYERRVFNDETSPNSKNYNFDETCIAVADISNPSETMTATLAPIDACPDHPRCERVAHGIVLTPAEGKDLSNVTLEEKWKDRVRARSRICHDRNASPFWASSGWVEIPESVTESPHFAEVHAGNTSSSYALAKSGIVITRSAAQVEAHAVVNSERTPSTDGCDRFPKKARRHAARAKTVGMAKVRASGSVRVSGLRWIGGFGNCKGRNRERLVKDPVDVEFHNITTGTVSRERIVDITSRVWDGETDWTYRITPARATAGLTPYRMHAEDGRGPGCGDERLVLPGPRGGFERILQNTARRMRFSVDVAGASIPPDQRGRLRIACRNGAIEALEASGTYAYVGSLLTVGQGSTFEIPLPAITVDLVAPGAPGDSVETWVEGGGGQTQDGLPETMVQEGCELTTGIADGLEDVDTSTPQGSDQTLGFDAGSSLQWIAQEFVIPPGQLLMASSISLLAYQQGMPTTQPPSVQSVTSRIYDGPPWQPGSHLLASSVTSGADLEAEWVELNRVAPGAADDGTRPVMELQLWCPDCPEVPLAPGSKWLVLSIAGDPNYGPVQMPPCPYPGDADNARGYVVGSGIWLPLLDAGSGRPVSFPIDIYGGARDDSTGSPGMTCLQPVVLAGLTTRSVPDGIRVTWNLSAGVPAESLEFNLLRSPESGGEVVKLNDTQFRGQRKYSFVDRSVVARESYRYQVEAVIPDGERHIAGAATAVFDLDGGPVANDFADALHLAPATPNPFAGETTIRFALPEDGPLTVRIFDSTGRLSRTLVSNPSCPAGEFQEVWDGRDERGRSVAAGIYYIQLQTPVGARTGRVLVVR